MEKFKPIEVVPDEVKTDLKPVIQWEDSLVFDPIGKDFVLTQANKDKIGKLALEGATDEEICLLCNINTKVWKNYLKENDVFSDWIKRLRNRTTFLARRNINLAIEGGHLELSKWKIEKEIKEQEKHNLRPFLDGSELISNDDDAILEAYVTKTITLKKTTKIPFKQAEDPKPLND